MPTFNSIHTGAQVDAAVSKVNNSGKIVTATAGRAISATDLGKTINFDSASDGNFTIPNDSALGLSGDDNASFEIYQAGSGAAFPVAGAGATLHTWLGYPTPSQYVTQTIHRVGANTWAVK